MRSEEKPKKGGRKTKEFERNRLDGLLSCCSLEAAKQEGNEEKLRRKEGLGNNERKQARKKQTRNKKKEREKKEKETECKREIKRQRKRVGQTVE